MTGCPIVLKRSSVGISNRQVTSHGQKASFDCDFGEMFAVGDKNTPEYVERQIILDNRGPVDAQIQWSFSEW